MSSAFEKIANEVMVEVDHETKTALRTLIFKPKEADETLVLVPGYASLVSAWDELLEAAKDSYNIVVIETPEKRSSVTSKKTRLDIDAVAEYIGKVIEHLQLEQYFIVTSSISSAFILRGLSKNYISPTRVFLVVPIEHMILPKWAWPFIYTGTRMGYYLFLKPLAKLVARVKYIHKDQKEQLLKYYGYLDSLDPIKVKRSLIALKNFKITEQELKTLKTKCVVIGASKDGWHAAELSKKLSQIIPNSVYYDLETNIAAHGKKLLELITIE